MIAVGSVIGVMAGSAVIKHSPQHQRHSGRTLEQLDLSRKGGPADPTDEATAAVAAADEFLLGADFSSSAAPDPTSLTSSAVYQLEKVTFPWEQEAVAMALCGNTCPAANNGVCDEGRPSAWTAASAHPHGPGIQVLCDLGTDCTDCGPWRFNATGDASTFQSDSPVKRLISQNVEVRLKPTSTKPSFLMPFTNPEFDVDVSSSMLNGGAVEMGLTQVWYQRLKGRCGRPDGGRGLVVDIGANFGWYTLFAAAMGCRVVAWEPVPHFRDFLKFGVAMNGFEHLIQVRERVVSDIEGEHDMVIPQRGIWGTAGVGGFNIDKGIDNERPYEHLKVSGERVDAVVREDVALLKMDVEGFEFHALESARRVFEQHVVENVVMEYSPGTYERNQKWENYPRYPGMLDFLVRKKFTLLHVFDNYTRAWVEPADWERPPPTFTQVLAANLVFDMEDAHKMQRRSMGCFNPPELVQRFNTWDGCNFIPEDLHPQSFRSSFGHNTNVLAVRDPGDQPIGEPVGVFALEQDLHEWFSNKPFGVGGRPCKDLQPPVQVRHRCPCTAPDVCGEEAALVTALASAGRMTPLGTGTQSTAAVA